MIRLPLRSTLFPYTTLFRSLLHIRIHCISKVLLMENHVCVCSFLASNAPLIAPERLQRLPCPRSEEHTSELQSRFDLVCRLLLEKKKKKNSVGCFKQ